MRTSPFQGGWFSRQLLPHRAHIQRAGAQLCSQSPQPGRNNSAALSRFHLHSEMEVKRAQVRQYPAGAAPCEPMAGSVWSKYLCLPCWCPGRARLDCTQWQSKSQWYWLHPVLWVSHSSWLHFPFSRDLLSSPSPLLSRAAL